MRTGFSWAVAAGLVLTGGGEALAQDDSDLLPSVVRIVASGCQAGAQVQTGFAAEVQGIRGLITALHGVAGCRRIFAQNQSVSLPTLEIGYADVDRDVVFLVGSGAVPDPLEEAPLTPGETLRVVGYPRAVRRQLSHTTQPHENARVALHTLLGTGAVVEAIRSRDSPEDSVLVLSLRRGLQPGYSGAPILDGAGRVIAVGSGGLAEGTAGINWAIPMATIDWSPRSDVQDELDRVAALDPRLAFTVIDEDGYNLSYTGWSVAVSGFGVMPGGSQDWGIAGSAAVHPRILGGRLALGIEAHYSRASRLGVYETLPEVIVPSPEQSLSTWATAAITRLHWYRPAAAPWSPYLTMAIGLSQSTFEVRSPVDTPDRALLLAAGGGLEISLLKTWGLTAEARVTRSGIPARVVAFNPLGRADVTYALDYEYRLEIRLGLRGLYRFRR